MIIPADHDEDRYRDLDLEKPNSCSISLGPSGSRFSFSTRIGGILEPGIRS